MTWKVEIYSELPDEAKAIRQAVFVEEQGFQEEFDELDNTEAVSYTHLTLPTKLEV